MQIARMLRRGTCHALNPFLSVFKLEMRWKEKPKALVTSGQSVERGGVGEVATLPTNGDGWNSAQPVPFGMVVPSVYGPVIVNRHDINQTNALIKTGKAFNHDQIEVLVNFMRNSPAESVCLDIGANFGLYALAFARVLRERGGVCHAFEAQRIIADMVGGTAVLNGVENLHIHHVAVGNENIQIPIPRYDYNKELNFGSVEFGNSRHEVLTQEPDVSSRPEMVRQVRIDDLGFQNVQFIKIDVEGMEDKVIDGAQETIARDRPLLCIEWLKSDKRALIERCKGFGYRVLDWEGDLLCIHPSRADQYPIKVELPLL